MVTLITPPVPVHFACLLPWSPGSHFHHLSLSHMGSSFPFNFHPTNHAMYAGLIKVNMNIWSHNGVWEPIASCPLGDSLEFCTVTMSKKEAIGFYPLFRNILCPHSLISLFPRDNQLCNKPVIENYQSNQEIKMVQPCQINLIHLFEKKMTNNSDFIIKECLNFRKLFNKYHENIQLGVLVKSELDNNIICQMTTFGE